jgi:Kef-type K+ transport system membrane component KefB
LKVIDDATFSAVVIMVIVTTLVAPPMLKLTLSWKAERLESTADRR